MSKITRALERAKREREAAQKSEAAPQNSRAESHATVRSSVSQESQRNAERPLRIHEPRTSVLESERKVKRTIVLRDGAVKRRFFKTIIVSGVLLVFFVVCGMVYVRNAQSPLATDEQELKNLYRKQIDDARVNGLSSRRSDRDVAGKSVAPAQVVAPTRQRDVIVGRVGTEIPVTEQSYEATVTQDPDKTIIASFNSGRHINELGGDFHATSSENVEAFYKADDSFNSVHARLGNGFALKIRYNVDHPTAVIENGLVMDVGSLPIDAYETIAFYLKGDREVGYSKSVMLVLLGDQTQKAYKLSNVRPRWEHVSIPLAQFKAENAELKELRLTFRSDIVTAKKGVVYVDDVSVSK